MFTQREIHREDREQWHHFGLTATSNHFSESMDFPLEPGEKDR